MAELSPELRELIASRFSSIEQIDVFVLLFRERQGQWSPQDVADALGVAPQSAGMRLFLLASAGMVVSGGERDVRYRYVPAPALDDIAAAIDDAHRSDRPALAAIFAAPPQSRSAQVFAEAFRLRKP